MSHKLDRFRLEVEFTKWKLQCGERKVSSKGTEYYVIPIESSIRRSLIKDFCLILMEQHGYVATDFDEAMCREIIKACVNSETKGGKLREWKESVELDVVYVFAELDPSAPIKEPNKKLDDTPALLKTVEGKEARKEQIKNDIPVNKYIPEREILDLSILPKIEMAQDKNSILEMLEREDNE